MILLDIKVTSTDPAQVDKQFDITMSMDKFQSVSSMGAKICSVSFFSNTFTLNVPKAAFVNAILTPESNLPIQTTIVEGTMTTDLKIYNA